MSWANIVAGVDNETKGEFVNTTNNPDEIISSVDFPTLAFSQEDSKKLKHHRYVSHPTPTPVVTENPTSALTRTLTNLHNQKPTKPNKTYKDKLTQRPKVKNPFRERKPEERESSESKPTRFNSTKPRNESKFEPEKASDNTQNKVFKDFYRKQQDSRPQHRVHKPPKPANEKPVRSMKYTNEARRSRGNDQSNRDRNDNQNRGRGNDNQNRGRSNDNKYRGRNNDNQPRRVRTTLEIFGDREPQPPREETRQSYDDLVKNQGQQRQPNFRSQRDKQVLLSDFL